MNIGNGDVVGGRWCLSQASDAELEQGLRELMIRGARNEAGVVAHLAEVDERRLHLRAGYESLFQYCLEELRLGDFEAYLRINAARIARRFPVVLDLLAERALHLTALRLLKDHLTPENHVELLTEAAHQSKRQIELLLAQRFPQADIPERLRELPRLQPLSPGRFRLELTLDGRQKEKLEKARDLLSHANPRGDLAIVIERGLDALIALLERRKLGKRNKPGRSERIPVASEPCPDKFETESQTQTESESQTQTSQSRKVRGRSRRASGSSRPHIRNQVRREVVGRDGWQCNYISPEGRRCTARGFLQFDHRHLWSHGGGDTPGNLRVLCGPHNRLLAPKRSA